MTRMGAVGVTGRGALPPRDAQVVDLVGRFRIMTAGQIGAAAFPNLTSKTPLDRCLARLTAADYLRRLARFVGGFGGGSGQYVYQLGRLGWRLTGKGGTYRPLRVVDVHTLTIAECFVKLTRLEQAGELTVVGYQPEPGSHLTVGGVQLTPDAYVELGLQARRLKFRYWLEIDRGTENMDTIRGKCVRYWKSYKTWPEEVFPFVVFVVLDPARGREIERAIAGGPSEAQALFQVYELDSFANLIHRNMLDQG